MYKLPVYFNPNTQQYVYVHKSPPRVTHNHQQYQIYHQQPHQQQYIQSRHQHQHTRNNHNAQKQYIIEDDYQPEYLQQQSHPRHINVVSTRTVQSGHTRLDKRDEEMQSFQMHGDPEINNFNPNQYHKYNLSDMRNAELLKSKEHSNIYTPKLNRPEELLNDLRNNKYMNERKKVKIPDGANLDDSYAPFTTKNKEDKNITKNFNEMIPNLKSINFEKVQNQKNNRREKFASVQDNIL
jgi:hypothetical protein